jgi:hypothetical protein
VIWSDAQNAELSTLRDPNILCPGDILYVPDPAPLPLSMASGTSNDYSAAIPTMSIMLAFQDDDAPFVNEPYTVEGLGSPEEQPTTDKNGVLTLDVPVHIREVVVTFPNRNTSYPLRIGDMDPIDEAAGARKRLQHLGYRETSESEEADVELRDRQAITSFQTDQEIDPTGELDEATKTAIVKEHGC